jgi:hypothetical protein
MSAVDEIVEGDTIADISFETEKDKKGNARLVSLRTIHR